MEAPWKLIVPAAVLAAGAAGTAVTLFLRGKKQNVEDKPAETATVPGYKAKAPAQGVYSFISGYKHAKQVEVTLTYDAEDTTFADITSDFPVTTSSPNAAVVNHPDYSFQLEACSYYSGEWFDTIRQDAAVNHPDCVDAIYGNLSGIRYTSGDNLCFCFPADDNSYLLLTVMTVKGSDVKLEEIPTLPAFAAVLSSTVITVG